MTGLLDKILSRNIWIRASWIYAASLKILDFGIPSDVKKAYNIKIKQELIRISHYWMTFVEFDFELRHGIVNKTFQTCHLYK